MVKKAKIDWTSGLLTKTFKLSKVLENYALLDDWLTVENDITDSENAELHKIRLPYFYFHEYKRKKNKADDPIAQVLIPSLIAQEMNADHKPIYGCYVMGEMWYFMIVNGREYAIDKGLNALKFEELQQIYLVLKKVKSIIVKRMESQG